MILRDPVHGLVSFEADEFSIVPRLLQAEEVQRLRRIRQLGLTSLAYPGADHTRFSHAIGAAHVMTRFIGRLRQIHGDLPIDQRVTAERARDAVAAAFLHDLGHGPLSHLFEEAVPDGPGHEVWTVRIVLNPATDVHRILSDTDPGLPERVAELIQGRHPLAFLASTVSGTFDVDRCDYLLRDAHFTGVSYGSFDLDWLVRSLRFGHPKTPHGAPHLAIDGVKGLPAIESFVLARLFMFQQVYFHKASRASEWHFSRILLRIRHLLRNGTRITPMPAGIESLLRTGDAQLEDYLGLDDSMLWSALASWRTAADPILSDLCQRLYSRRLFKTLELFGADCRPERYAELLERLRERSRAAGLDPEYYVGLDEAVDVPFDNSADPLAVIFPDDVAHAPQDVSFILGRLWGETLTRTRLVFPNELREDLLAHLKSAPLS
ncbi:MAG: HD domain-containing protein [Deltaproteobacteria bacterium]